mmetsp:Transcript_13676/g.39094  ORF Transcript_13676/g.39094 Transcript_13676/m.39094 type:complete len:223 (+) Transcript_13676:1025-1693(+)
MQLAFLVAATEHGKFILERGHLLLQTSDHQGGIQLLVDHRVVLDTCNALGEAASRHRLVQIGLLCGDGAYHQSPAVPAKGVSEHRCQNGVPVWHVLPFALRAFVQCDDDLLEVMERKVDGRRFLLELALHARLADTLAAGEVHQVQLRTADGVTIGLRGLDPQNEHAMASRRRVVHGRLGDDAVRVAEKQQVEGILFPLRHVHRQVAQLDVALLVFSEDYLG